MLADRASIAELYSREFTDLHRHVARKLGDRSEAEDVVQDAYVRMMTLPADHPTLRNARAFLFTVASNLAVDTVRREQRLRRLFPVMTDNSTAFDGDATEVICPRRSTEDQVDAVMRLACVMQALEGLPSSCRQAFVLHKIQEFSYAEVAAEMGVTVSMVEKHLARALQHLRGCQHFENCATRCAGNFSGACV
jgi:RNA polymerase sigma factor (sigma-70 family)